MRGAIMPCLTFWATFYQKRYKQLLAASTRI